MHEVLVRVARLALVAQVVSILEEQGHRISGDICLFVSDMPNFDDWVEQVLPELSVLATDIWRRWLETGVGVYGVDDLAWEMYHVITGSGGAKEDDCTQYVRGGCMPYLPDLGYLVACCACE
jgi:hypothetical protein